MSLSSVYIRSLVGRKLMNRKWQKCRMAFGVLRKGWSEEKEEEEKGHTEPLVIGVQVAHLGSGVPTHGGRMYVQGTSRKILSKHVHCGALSALTEPLPHSQP